ncbi:universal stress protein [Saccharopolyspora sp. NPDC049357]|uniref:universal stress protein n=1 Tax=Saccharopolyspora sp. NPDC049357 TaxID=3154507 RepID=UPI003430FE04
MRKRSGRPRAGRGSKLPMVSLLVTTASRPAWDKRSAAAEPESGGGVTRCGVGGQCRFTSCATLRTRVSGLEPCGSDRCGEIGWSGNVSRSQVTLRWRTGGAVLRSSPTTGRGIAGPCSEAPGGAMEGSKRRIVVGVDGSAGSRAALRWALGYAEGCGGRVVAVFACGVPALIDVALMMPEE